LGDAFFFATFPRADFFFVALGAARLLLFFFTGRAAAFTFFFAVFVFFFFERVAMAGFLSVRARVRQQHAGEGFSRRGLGINRAWRRQASRTH
jgi:hypothetical protein